MEREIRTIFFDVDSAFRTLIQEENAQRQSDTALVMLIRSRESHEALFVRLAERWAAYRKRAAETLLELSEAELWTRCLLPEYEPNLVYANAPRLTRLWLDREGQRETRPEAAETVMELFHRGYRLGILANTPSETDLPDWAVDEGIAQCFHTTLLSCKMRLRLPDRAAFRLVCRCAETPPEQCAFVSADPAALEGAAGAGFALCVQMTPPEEYPDSAPPYPAAYQAAFRTAALPRNLLDIFPPVL